jgi:hypothetical protein
MKIGLHPEAVGELREAVKRYAAISKDLAESLHQEIEHAREVRSAVTGVSAGRANYGP